MIRYLFASLLIIHGLLHLLGFIKSVRPSLIPQLTGIITRTNGILWLAVCIIFIITVVLYFIKKEYWWIPALTAIILSQVLIISYWKDAKWGTIANIIILFVIIPAYSEWNLNKKFRSEAKIMLNSIIPGNTKVIYEEDLEGFPNPVRLWLKSVGIIGKPMINSVFIRQKGEMRTKPGGKWVPFEALQYNITNPPGLLWKAKIEPAPYFFISGNDKYLSGQGQMSIRLAGLIPVANETGEKIGQGSILRYLAEICWFPSAALSKYIHWQEINSLSAKATMSYEGISASGIYHFTEKGDVLQFEADRYYISGKQPPSLERWVIRNIPSGYKEFHGIRIPASSEVTWKLKSGDHTWLRLVIEDIEYNDFKLH